MKNKLKIILVSIFLSGCSFSDLTDPFTNLISSDEILFLSAYENVKIVEQDSQINWSKHTSCQYIRRKNRRSIKITSI